MKRRYIAAIALPLFLISQQITAIAATPTATISNISPNKQQVQPSGLLRVTWNFSSENLLLDEAKKMEVFRCEDDRLDGQSGEVRVNQSGGFPWRTRREARRPVGGRSQRALQSSACREEGSNPSVTK